MKTGGLQTQHKRVEVRLFGQIGLQRTGRVARRWIVQRWREGQTHQRNEVYTVGDQQQSNQDNRKEKRSRYSKNTRQTAYRYCIALEQIRGCVAGLSTRRDFTACRLERWKFYRTSAAKLPPGQKRAKQNNIDRQKDDQLPLAGLQKIPQEMTQLLMTHDSKMIT